MVGETRDPARARPQGLPRGAGQGRGLEGRSGPGQEAGPEGQGLRVSIGSFRVWGSTLTAKWGAGAGSEGGAGAGQDVGRDGSLKVGLGGRCKMGLWAEV